MNDANRPPTTPTRPLEDLVGFSPPAADLLATPRASVRRRRCGGDRGFTLIEILVSIVLLGLAATGTLVAMAAAVRGSASHRDLTNAQSWLQSASDNLQGQPRQDCDNVGGVAGEAEARIRSTYQTYVQTVGSPDGWAPGQITVLNPVLFWDGDQYQTTCYDNFGINLQLVTLQVRNPSGQVVRKLQVVKGA